MTPRIVFSGTIFLAVIGYLALGFLTQAAMGAVPWSDTSFALGTSLVVAAIIAAAGYAVAGLVRKPAVFPAGAQYKPGRVATGAAAAVVSLASIAGIWLSVSKVLDERAVAQAAKQAAAERRAALAAMTPEQRAAQQKSQAEAAARAASERAAVAAAAAAASAQKQAARDAENGRVALAGLGAAALKQAMKDPEAFELRSAYVLPSGAACYEYRAKNSFGAILPSSAILTRKGKILTRENDGNAFVNAWNKECTAEGGREVADLLKRAGVI